MRELSNAWTSTKLEALANSFAGGTPTRSSGELYGGAIPWVKSGELRKPAIHSTEEYLSSLGLAASSAKWVPAMTPLIAMYGATAGCVSWLAVEATTNQAVLALVPRSADVFARWLYWQLTNQAERLLASVQGSGQPNLSKGLVDRHVVLFPPLPEQRAIAAVLDTIDDAIQKTEQIIAKLQQVKQGMLHDLLTRGIDDNGELRDPERHPEQFQDSPLGRIPKGWEVAPFGTLCESSAFGPRFPADRYSSSGALATLRTTDISDDGEIDLTTMPRAAIPPSVFSSHLLRPFDLVISRSGTCGIAAVFPGHSLAVVPGAFLIRFRLRRAPSSAFFRRYFNSKLGRPRMERLAVGGVQKNIKGSEVLSLLVPSPPDNEQDTIVATVESIGDAERREAEELAKFRVLKAGLAEDLLTGRVRTTSLPEVAA